MKVRGTARGFVSCWRSRPQTAAHKLVWSVPQRMAVGAIVPPPVQGLELRPTNKMQHPPLNPKPQTNANKP